MPVIFNEPITFLQRICEYMEYGHILQTAQTKDDPLVRMQVSRLLHLLKPTFTYSSIQRRAN